MTDTDAGHGTETSALISTILARGVVPAWVAAGALFKLVEATPANLPKNLFELGKTVEQSTGLSLITYLGLFIAVEFVAVATMVLVPRLARLAAMAMLAVFCLVLAAELVTGNFTSCGCFGKIPVPPWAMLLVDGGMLVALLVLPGTRAGNPSWSIPAAGLGSVLGIVATVAVLRASLNDPVPPAPPPPDPIDSTPGTTDPLTPTGPDAFSGPPFTARGALPDYYYPELESWTDTRFLETDFAELLYWPADIEDGRRHVILYSRTCDHCQHLINTHIKDDPAIPTIALAMAENKNAFEESGVLPMQLGGCTSARLPLGCDWLVTPPVVIAIEDGIVKCAAEEGEDPACLLWSE